MSDIRIIIEHDPSPESPREWDNLGTMVAFHGRYSLGDKGHGFRTEDYSSWGEMESGILRKNPGSVILPLYLYDHSGLAMNTTGFSCPWDSGQVGFIYATPDRIRECFMVKRISRKTRLCVKAALMQEVETYSQFLNGDVYLYRIEGGEHDGDSCGGFYGTDPWTNGMTAHIPLELHDLLP